MSDFLSLKHTQPKAKNWLNGFWIFLPGLSYVISGGDFFLPFAVTGIAAIAGLLSPSYHRKTIALWVLVGALCAILAFVGVELLTSELTLAPPSKWF